MSYHNPTNKWNEIQREQAARKMWRDKSGSETHVSKLDVGHIRNIINNMLSSPDDNGWLSILLHELESRNEAPPPQEMITRLNEMRDMLSGTIATKKMLNQLRYLNKIIDTGKREFEEETKSLYQATKILTLIKNRIENRADTLSKVVSKMNPKKAGG